MAVVTVAHARSQTWLCCPGKELQAEGLPLQAPRTPGVLQQTPCVALAQTRGKLQEKLKGEELCPIERHVGSGLTRNSKSTHGFGRCRAATGQAAQPHRAVHSLRCPAPPHNGIVRDSFCDTSTAARSPPPLSLGAP